MRRQKNRPVRAKAVAAPTLPWPWFWLLAAAMSLVFATTLRGAEALSSTALERKIWLADEKEFWELEQRVSREIQLHPRSAFAHYLMAHLYVRMFASDPSDMKLLRRASELGQQAVEVEQEKDYGYVVIAEILDLMGQSANGVKILDTKLNPRLQDTWRTYFMRARLQSERLRPEEVLDLLEKAMSQPDAQRDVIAPYVVALLKESRDGTELISELEEWHKKYPNELFMQSQAIAFSDLGQYRRAHTIYKQIYAKNPRYKEALINDAVLLVEKLASRTEAEATFERVLKDFATELEASTEAVIHMQLGTISLDARNFKKASGHFTRAIKLQQDQPEFLDNVVTVYKSRKISKEFASFLDRLNQDVPGVGVYHALLGETLSEELKEHDRALRAYGNAIALDPERSDFYNGMGLAYYRMEKLDRALSLFTTATKIDPEDATSRYNEACVFARMGRRDEAVTSLKEALTLNPQLAETARQDGDFANMKEWDAFERLLSVRKESNRARK